MENNKVESNKNKLLDQLINDTFNEEIEITELQSHFLDLWIMLGMPEQSELGLLGISKEEFENPTIKTIKKLEIYIDEINKDISEKGCTKQKL
ncbi:MAG: hypothetical protein NC181_05645 [Clostridium sp.]|nr:hypothetical protein [Clostridium sp.]MCM1444747.1 hypothetical protein [Candidatus Amulumruptor caecigallinarius]